MKTPAPSGEPAQQTTPIAPRQAPFIAQTGAPLERTQPIEMAVQHVQTMAADGARNTQLNSIRTMMAASHQLKKLSAHAQMTADGPAQQRLNTMANTFATTSSPLARQGVRQAQGLSSLTLQVNAPIQRYLIVGDHDYTDDVKGQIQPLANVTAGVLQNIILSLNPPHFPIGTPENAMSTFLTADAGGLVTRQLSKWIEDMQGQAGVNSHPNFGRKQQARVYDNYVDLGRALYGWVNGKAGRREEKHLANQVYASPLVEAQINSVLVKLKAFADGPGSSPAMDVALALDNPLPAVAPWADYRNWFNHYQPGAVRAIPAVYADVLADPGAHDLRAKIAVLHDVMNYLLQHNQLAVMPTLNATTANGRVPYQRPSSSLLSRDSVNRELVGNVAAARLPTAAADGSPIPPRVRSANDERHPTYAYARANAIPMWGRHSYTAARMMTLTRQVGGDDPEMRAVADSIMAFWRKDYDHRSIAYHTLHEIQDFTPDFNLGPYNPLTRYDDTHNRLDVLPTLITRVSTVANSPNWNNLVWHVRGPNTAPVSIIAIRAELASGNANPNKLDAIKTAIHGKIGFSLMRNEVTKKFYRILDQIPANVGLYSQPGISRAVRSAIAIDLSRVLRQLNGFNP